MVRGYPLVSHSDRYRHLLTERLRALIESRGESVLQVEKQLGRGRGYVADALRGHKKLTIEVILAILDTLGIEPEEFFEGRRVGGGHLKVPAARDAGSGAATGGDSPLVQAIVLLLTQGGVSPTELREIGRAVDVRRACAGEQPRRRPRTAKR